MKTRYQFLLTLLNLFVYELGYCLDKDTSKVVKSKAHHFFLGPGIGMDHGGAGMQIQYMPVKWIGVFVSGGTNLANLNYVLGARTVLPVDEDVAFYATASYGFNGTLFSFRNTGIFENLTSKGFVVGGGFEFTFYSSKMKLNIGGLYTKRDRIFYRNEKYYWVNAITIGLKYPLQF